MFYILHMYFCIFVCAWRMFFIAGAFIHIYEHDTNMNSLARLDFNTVASTFVCVES